MLMMLLILSLTSILAVYILLKDPRVQQARSWPAVRPVPPEVVESHPVRRTDMSK